MKNLIFLLIGLLALVFVPVVANDDYQGPPGAELAVDIDNQTVAEVHNLTALNIQERAITKNQNDRPAIYTNLVESVSVSILDIRPMEGARVKLLYSNAAVIRFLTNEKLVT